MTLRKQKKLLFRLTLFAALFVGLARGWVRGVQVGQPSVRASDLTVRIDSDGIGARLDSWTGELSLLQGAGYHWALPGLSEVHRLSRGPVTVTFGGEEKEPERAQLTVRSPDGSGFYFQEVRVTARVSEAGALTFLRDSGNETRLQVDWLAALARPILREEFGAHTVQDVTDALVCDGARARASARLSVELAKHGIELLEVTASKPSFDRNYEMAIAQRKVADQEVERLVEDLVLKLREREERLGKTQAEILTRDEILSGNLERTRIEAVTTSLKNRGAAETWAVKRRSEGLSRQNELLAKASAVEAQGQRQAESFQEELASLEGRGQLAIRERLVQSLSKTHFKLTPFTQDPSPERFERVTLSEGDSK